MTLLEIVPNKTKESIILNNTYLYKNNSFCTYLIIISSIILYRFELFLHLTKMFISFPAASISFHSLASAALLETLHCYLSAFILKPSTLKICIICWLQYSSFLGLPSLFSQIIYNGKFELGVCISLYTFHRPEEHHFNCLRVSFQPFSEHP